MATSIDIPDIAAACPSGLDPLERAGQILASLGLWVAIEASGTPAVAGYGFTSGSGRVVSTTGTDLDASASSILSILSAGSAPTSNPFITGFTSDNQLAGYQDVPFGSLVSLTYIATGRLAMYNSNRRWEDVRTGTERTPAH